MMKKNLQNLGTLLLRICLILFIFNDFCLSQNAISIENALPGNPSSEWDISGAGDLNIQGFATDLSINKGDPVDFKINVNGAVTYNIKIYRLGFYDGDGARLITDLGDFSGVEQPTPIEDLPTGLVDCGNWSVSATWSVPGTAVSGVYIAKLTRSDNDGASHIVFVVRDDTGNSDLLFKTSDATWQAYNGYGGNSLYTGSVPGYPGGHATKVSYNRPFITRNGGAGGGPEEDWIFNAEYPMIRWLERNGYDVSYATDVDMDRSPTPFTTSQHKILLSVGHDEYWSANERAKFEGSRNNGVHLAFFSGNEVYWKTRWENSIDGSNTAHRTLVCYKEGTIGENVCGSKCDGSTNTWTGLWRDGTSTNYPGSDGGSPENALTGQISWVGTSGSIQVPDTYKDLRFWRNTNIATNTGTTTLTANTLGYEWDPEQPQYATSYPAGRILLSETDFSGQTHHLSLYRHASGALVFGSGTVQWSWGLDGEHDRGNDLPSPDMQQATVNLFADMGAQPENIQTGTLATASTDVTPPVSIIANPVDAETLSGGSLVTITGTASDQGGVLAGVEVSVDGGLTWTVATGTANWSFNWITGAQGAYTIRSRAFDDSGNLEVPTQGQTNYIDVTVGPPGAVNCPCSIWNPATTVPGTPNEQDPTPIEVGVKFRTAVAGFITGIRFYKGSQNTGAHTGNLWTLGGVNLGSVLFTGETASGWQEAFFNAPIAIDANTTYVASYFTPSGYYSEDENYFTTGTGAAGVVNGPLLAIASSDPDGPNSVYLYTASSAFPTDTYIGSNYYVDVVFETSVGPDVTPPVVSSVAPGNNANAVSVNTAVSVTFSEPIDQATLNGSTFVVTTGGNPVSGTVTYSSVNRTATFSPAAVLTYSSAYTATVSGDPSGIADLANNQLASDYTWSFTTSGPPPPPPSEGLDGPILLISNATNPFSRYPVEILRAEGFNNFFATDISNVTPTLINDYDVVILGEMPLTAPQVTLLTDWVTAGGTLIAFKPNVLLSPLLGISAAGGGLSDQYLLFNTGSGPGVGLVNQTIQFHGTADYYNLNTATALATLYANATTATAYPAVTTNNVGANGGKAIAFTYDLARSIVYTRQGNPAWAGQSRDGQAGPIRSDNLYFGNAAGDPQPDYVDFNKIDIPQADEQQHLLSNIIIQGNLHRKPLPRFWFLPRKLKAAVVMTGDDHASGGTIGRFNQYLGFGNNSAQDIRDWKAIRGTSYIYSSTNNTSTITDAQAAAFEAQGFEIAAHLTTNCGNFTSESDLDNTYFTPQLAEFANKWPSVPAPSTNRTHCIAWSDWASQPKAEAAKGIRLDCNYYYWPDTWVLDRPGMFTGSGMPMRFADLDGSLIDCYQVTTQLTDESGISYSTHIDALLDKAIGAEGYYGVFCANMHTDVNGGNSTNGSDAIIASAQARQIPVISARQMLTWLDGRNSSSFDNLAWDNNTLNFDLSIGSGANNLYGMLPVNAANGQLISLTVDGNPVIYTTELIKGINYAFFPTDVGSYAAIYGVDVTPPVISNIQVATDVDGTATITWDTDEPASTVVDYALTGNPLNLNVTAAALVVNHSAVLSGLTLGATYDYRVSSADAALNTAESPVAPGVLSFVMPTALPPPCAEDLVSADFALGTPDASTLVVAEDDGGVVLNPVLNEDFSGNVVPGGWSESAFNPGSTTVSGGTVTANGTHVYSNTNFGPGSTLEFVATFNAASFQNIGFSDDQPFNTAPWVTIGQGGSPDGNLYARSSSGGNINIGSNLLGSEHRYRIKWNTNDFEFFVDGNTTPAATISFTVASNMYIQISDVLNNDGTLTVDWLRVTPYATSGSYTSRVFDQGAPNGWGIANWTASLPDNTSLAVWVRTGNAAVPDGSWTSFIPVSNGAPVGGSNRYLQYRADLASSDNQFTPVLEEITIECGTAPDNTPPVITNVQATPAPDGLSAIITWDTDEAANSLVEYGTSPGNLNLSVSGATFVLLHNLLLTGLTPGTTYYFRVTSEDPSSNSDTEPDPPGTLNFTTPIPPCFNDVSVTDFALGTFSGTYLSLIDEGVILKPTAAAEFSVLPPTGEWQSFPWTGGTSTVSGGALIVDGARFNSQPTGTTFSPGAVLEYVATFGASTNQHIGFGGGTDATGSGGIYNGESDWAMFSTAGTINQLFARTKSGASEVNMLIAGSFIGSAHRYRIEWNVGTVLFYIDGDLVHTETVSIAGPMRPALSDYNNDGTVLQVDWIHVTPYAASGTFTSRAYDAGGVKNWGDANWSATVPVGTTLQLYQRQGNTPVPDGSWTLFTLIPASGTNVGGTSRYIQYRADFTTSNTGITPLLQEVGIDCSPCTTEAASLTNSSLGNTICEGDEVTFTAGPAGAVNYEFFVDNGSVQTGSSNTFTSSTLSSGSNVHVVVTAENICNVTSFSITQSTVSQFNEGVSGACSIWEIEDGELTLAPLEGSQFDGITLPTGWTSTPWSGGGASTVSGGQVTVDGSLLVTDAFYAPGRVIEFDATFGPATFQHIGFGVDVNSDANWAMFSTSNTTDQLYVRTNNGTSAMNVSVGGAGVYINSLHRYRIEWNTNTVLFYIDGALVHTENVTISASMRPLASDLSVGGGSASINWLRMSPYTSPCTYESKIFDAGSSANWGLITWLSDEPVGTSVTISARTGNTPVPDGTWTAFSPVNNGSNIGESAQYAQYQAVLQTSDPALAPALKQISLAYSIVGTYSATSGSQSIIVLPAPTTSAAGPDQTIAVGNATLAGNTPVVGTGLWTITNGSATITNPASPTSTLTGIAAESSVTLRWTISNITCTSFDEVTISRHGVVLRSKVFLEGPYDVLTTNVMNDGLRAAALLPTTEPYTALGFTHVGGGGGETVQPGVFDVTGNDAIVDWVFIELRDKNNSTVPVATAAALLQADGDIVGMDGTSDVSFTGVVADDYYIVIRHRNHLGFRTMNAIALSSTPSLIDLTNGSVTLYGINPLKSFSGVFVMYAGEANFDGQVNAVDLNDYWRVQNGLPYSYLGTNADFNLDGAINAVDLNEYWRLNNSFIQQLD